MFRKTSFKENICPTTLYNSATQTRRSSQFHGGKKTNYRGNASNWNHKSLIYYYSRWSIKLSPSTLKVDFILLPVIKTTCIALLLEKSCLFVCLFFSFPVVLINSSSPFFFLKLLELCFILDLNVHRMFWKNTINNRLRERKENTCDVYGAECL